jgi:drug/metabolite transporter (DMT)-like permease
VTVELLAPEPQVRVPGALATPSRVDGALLAVAVTAVSFAGPIAAALRTPPLAIAFWRCAFAAAALVLVSAAVYRRALPTALRSGGWTPVWAGVLLALHFALWIPSLSLTSVASSTALVVTQPIWSAVIVARRGHAVPRLAWVGMSVAVAGVATVTGFDVATSGRAVVGDLLSLAAAVMVAASTVLAGDARQRMSTTAFTTASYGTAAVVLGGICLVARVDLTSYAAHDWLLLAAMTAGPQLLGHSVFNHVVATTSATVVSLFLLFEVPGAILVALVWLGQVPSLTVVPGIVLLLVGVALVIRSVPPQEVP